MKAVGLGRFVAGPRGARAGLGWAAHMAIYRYSYEFPAYQSLSKCVFLIFQPSHLIKNVATFFSSTFLVIFRHVEKMSTFLD
jgi:hypothetical protein